MNQQLHQQGQQMLKGQREISQVLTQGHQQLAQLIIHLIGQQNVDANNQTTTKGSENHSPRPPNV